MPPKEKKTRPSGRPADDLIAHSDDLGSTKYAPLARLHRHVPHLSVRSQALLPGGYAGDQQIPHDQAGQQGRRQNHQPRNLGAPDVRGADLNKPLHFAEESREPLRGTKRTPRRHEPTQPEPGRGKPDAIDALVFPHLRQLLTSAPPSAYLGLPPQNPLRQLNYAFTHIFKDEK